MSLHIVLLGLVLLLALGFFVFGWLTESKIFFIGAFIVLMLAGIFIQAEQGIMLGSQVSGVAANGSFIYSAIEYSTAVPSVNLISMMFVLIGGVLTAYSGIAFVFSSSEESPMHY